MQEDISVSEYRKLLVGIMGNTPLGEVVRIRAETDRETIEQMTVQEKKIRSEWQKFRTSQNQTPQITISLEQFQQMMKSLAG